jgi:hypothetical protein
MVPREYKVLSEKLARKSVGALALYGLDAILEKAGLIDSQQPEPEPEPEPVNNELWYSAVEVNPEDAYDAKVFCANGLKLDGYFMSGSGWMIYDGDHTLKNARLGRGLLTVLAWSRGPSDIPF